MAKPNRSNDPAANPDPITNAPGAHPVGTGIGAAAGGAAAVGAVVGSGAGPVGSVVGAVVGAVAGGLVGKGVAEGINPTVEHEYWRANYTRRPYVNPGSDYEEYAPAYQYGWESHAKYSDRSFEDAEIDLARDWDRVKGNSKLDWTKAKFATRDAWGRAAYRSKDV